MDDPAIVPVSTITNTATQDHTVCFYHIQIVRTDTRTGDVVPIIT